MASRPIAETSVEQNLSCKHIGYFCSDVGSIEDYKPTSRVIHGHRTDAMALRKNANIMMATWEVVQWLGVGNLGLGQKVRNTRLQEQRSVQGQDALPKGRMMAVFRSLDRHDFRCMNLVY